MNKQVLTKTFSFSKCLLLFFLSIGLVFTGCKEDYDDDIKNLQDQITGLKTATDKIATLESGLTEAKAAAETAKTNADKAITDAKTSAEAAAAAEKIAKEAKDLAETSGSTEAIEKAQKAADAAKEVADKALTEAQDAAKEAARLATDAKEQAIAATEAELKSLKERVTALEGAGISQAEMEKIVEEVLKQLPDIEAKVSAMVGHRLTSLVRIPNTTLNDEPAIILQNLTYVPQVYDPLHTAYTTIKSSGGTLTESVGNGEVTMDITGAKRFYLANGKTEVKYQVSPKLGVRTQDIENLYFMGDVQTNLNMRAVSENLAKKDSPLKVDSWKLDEATGVLSVYAVKSPDVLNENINFEGQGGDIQKYYIASLRAGITEANRTQDEIDNNIVPEVASEYSRIAETFVTPMIKQLIDNNGNAVAAHVPHSGTYDRKELLNGKNKDGRYVHFHDRKSLYEESGEKSQELIDYTVQWNEDVDLRKYAGVCEFEKLYLNPDGTVNKIEPGSHATMDYASYGLKLVFTIDGQYITGDNKTDQQQFAKILADGYTMNSKAYDIDQKTVTAVDREPIVRVQLIDTKNNNNLVAERYIKFRWISSGDPKPITIDMGESIVSCKMIDGIVLTKQMNEEFYFALENTGIGWSKSQFHAVYKQAKIVSLTHDGVEVLKAPLTWKALDDTYKYGSSSTPTGITVAQADEYAKEMTVGDTKDDQIAEDVIFAMAKDQNDPSMSYNLKWYMSPAAVGTIKDFKSSEYRLKVEFVDETGSNSSVEATFIHKVKVPEQKFTSQNTYWETGKPLQVYNVNPSIYEAPVDYQGPTGYTPNFSTTWTGWNTGKDHYNHIGADLVKGYLNDVTKETPANVDEFIAYIRSCAKVRFEFDDTRFANYPHLTGYTVTNERQALWSNAQPPLTDAELQVYSHPGTKNDSRYDRLAATLWNKFGATAAENKKTEAKNMPYAYDENLGTKVNEAVAQMWLSEIDDSNGSTAAINLIDKKVPMQLIVEYNAWNKVPVQTFEMNIWKPIEVNKGNVDFFTDAVVNGSYIDVQQGVTYADWQGYQASRAASLTIPSEIVGTKEEIKWLFPQVMWDYYQIRDVVFQTKTAKTNLRLVGNEYKPVAGETNGNLPSKTTILQVDAYDQISGYYNEVLSDPIYLRYFNDKGTPVNEIYEIYMDVVVGYKWGHEVSKVTIPVHPAKKQ